MIDTDVTAEAATALTSQRWRIPEAVGNVPARPGLYAIYGDAAALTQLGVDREARLPLYVGKSESSLVGRELEGHFAANRSKPARTGCSTVRRSFAALLRDPLDLHAVPRNAEQPERFSHYALADGGDERLTAWMHEHLEIAVWVRPSDAPPLLTVEQALIARWTPPINLKDNPRPWPHLDAARRLMAREAEEWARERGDEPATADGTGTAPPPPQPASGSGPTPSELAAELDVDPKRIRRILREAYGTTDGARWGELTDEQVDVVRRRLG